MKVDDKTIEMTNKHAMNERNNQTQILLKRIC